MNAEGHEGVWSLSAGRRQPKSTRVADNRSPDSPDTPNICQKGRLGCNQEHTQDRNHCSSVTRKSAASFGCYQCGDRQWADLQNRFSGSRPPKKPSPAILHNRTLPTLHTLARCSLSRQGAPARLKGLLRRCCAWKGRSSPTAHRWCLFFSPEPAGLPAQSRTKDYSSDASAAKCSRRIWLSAAFCFLSAGKAAMLEESRYALHTNRSGGSPRRVLLCPLTTHFEAFLFF